MKLRVFFFFTLHLIALICQKFTDLTVNDLVTQTQELLVTNNNVNVAVMLHHKMNVVVRI